MKIVQPMDAGRVKSKAQGTRSRRRQARAVALVRSAAAFDTARRYHIAVTADGGVTGSTPTPREIYVQRLLSQSRNSVTGITGPQTISVGQTVQYVVNSSTSTTYEQLSDF